MKNDYYIKDKLIKMWHHGFSAGLDSKNIESHLYHRDLYIKKIMKHMDSRIRQDKKKRGVNA